MRKFKILILCLLLILQIGNPYSVSIEAGELHAIIVGNTDYKGFWGFSMEAIDVETIQKEIHHVSQQTGLTLQEQILVGNQMTTSNLVKAINELNVGEDDVIFFYFTGFGQWTADKKNQWPNLTFVDRKSLDLGSIKDSLQQKNPRLVIAIAQACNVIVSPQEFALPLVELKTPAINRPPKRDSFVYDFQDAYAELFLSASGCVVASAAVPGAVTPSSEIGGDFTVHFVSKLRSAASKKEKINWQMLFDSMIRSMNDGSRWFSHPVYSIEP